MFDSLILSSLCTLVKMPSVTDMNQSAPFWDFLANLERDSQHPFRSQSRNARNENNRKQEHEDDDGTASPLPWGCEQLFRGSRETTYRGPPPHDYREANKDSSDLDTNNKTQKYGRGHYSHRDGGECCGKYGLNMGLVLVTVRLVVIMKATIKLFIMVVVDIDQAAICGAYGEFGNGLFGSIFDPSTFGGPAFDPPNITAYFWRQIMDTHPTNSSDKDTYVWNPRRLHP